MAANEKPAERNLPFPPPDNSRTAAGQRAGSGGAASSTQRARGNWFRERAAYPFREADPEPVVQYRRQRKDSGDRWESLGPSNVSGRLTCLALHPENPQIVFAGSAGGGVWRSRDGGGAWEALWSKQESLNVGSLAIDPRNPSVIYCGTGEANGSSENYPGAGLYRSTDGGDTWSLVINITGDSLFPRRIGALAVKTRFNPRTDTADTIGYVLTGSVTHSDYDLSRLIGCRIFEDGHAITEFDPNFISGQNYWCPCVLYHPEGRAYVTVQAKGRLSGIWRSDELGGNWRHLEKGLPPSETFGRTSLAIAPSDPSILYALAADLHDRVLGVFRSRDYGETWKPISGSHFAREKQGSYNNCIAVDPKDPDRVYCGCLNLHRTRHGGRNWETITSGELKARKDRYVHNDFHAIAIPEHKLIYVATDGGMFVSTDGGNKWKDCNRGLVTTMFYDIDVAPSNGNMYGGGAQDNGTLLHDPEGEGKKFVPGPSGDGGWTLFGPVDPFHIWASSQRMDLRRLNKDRTRWLKVTPRGATREERNAVWLAYLAMDTSPGRKSPRTVFTGTTRVWRTRSDGVSWEAVSGHLDGSVISAIDVATADPGFVYVGTTNGGFFRSIDGGHTWSENLAGPELPGRIITRIESHPRDPESVLLTVGETPRDRRIIVQLQSGGGELAPATSRFSHVFCSRDGGFNWAAADFFGGDRRQLPDVPFNSLSFETRAPYRVFLGGDAGVFAGHFDYDKAAIIVSTSPPGTAGQNFFAEKVHPLEWADITGDMPNVPVTDVVYHAATKTLFAATYGRGIWRLKVEEKRVPPGTRRRRSTVRKWSRKR